MNEHLYAVIMAGGIGSRLWPRSRSATPKQFLDLLSGQTMLQQTVERIHPLVPLSRLLVVVSQEHVGTVHSQIPGLPAENILVEPGPRGTAPCIGLAAIALQQRDPSAIMSVFPADHRVADPAGFRQAISAAAQIAQEGYLVTLGITPTHAHTGYGYIQRGTTLGSRGGLEAFRVQCFTEKPDLSTAQRYVESGEYFWNGGIFVWQAEAILEEMDRLLPVLFCELQTIAAVWNSPQYAQTLGASWEKVPQTTIDYGIMEKSTRVAVLPVDIGWDDVGNWSTLSKLVDTDEQGNVIRGEGPSLLLDTKDSYVYSAGKRLVAAIGLEGFVVVNTPDALLICPKEKAQAVREVVDRLKAEGLLEYL